MTDASTEVDDKLHKELNEKQNKDGKPFNDVLAEKAVRLLVSSQIYKQPRMNTLAIYEQLYNNNVPPKLRQLFNAVPPIFSGLVDELLAMFNDEVKIKLHSKNPAQDLVIPKLQAHIDVESKSIAPNALWNKKTRMDRYNAIISGQGHIKAYAYNDPEYTQVWETVNYADFHCDPLGGPIWELHSFQGTENNFKTEYELKNDPKYDQDQVKKLIDYVYADDMFTQLEDTYGTRFVQWRALGFDISTNSFTGEKTYNLCDFVITHNGIRYNIVFEPCTGIWVYVKAWKEIMPSGMYPIQSWATHENDKNALSKSYADDFFSIADVVITLLNQELTNREKKNFNARAFDKDMFTDVGKLDAAQFRPDALVPANTQGGTKKIAEGIYAFDTPQLQGTINLVQWLNDYVGNKTGADELPQGSEKNKKAIIQMQQKKQSQRVGLRSASFNECYACLGQIFIEGCKEFMDPKMSVRIVGENGFIEEQELKRIEVEELGEVDITITSKSEQENSEQSKKEGQVEAISQIQQNPNLTRYQKEVIYRNIGQFDEGEIALLLDNEGKLSKKQYAHASQAIQDLLLGKKPEVYYGADIAYLTYFNMYILDHKNELKGKEKSFADFLAIIGPIAQKNAQNQAKQQPPPQPTPEQQEQQQAQKQQQQKNRPYPKASLPQTA